MDIMKNFINWFEIPVKKFNRAVAFYNAILEVNIEIIEMFGTKMGFFPSNGKNVSGAIVKGKNYTPSNEGVLIYLNGGDDLQTLLDMVEPNHGKVILAKTPISPEMGYFALFLDTEGNRIAVHSIN